jgi:hypothetical protein
MTMGTTHLGMILFNNRLLPMPKKSRSMESLKRHRNAYMAIANNNHDKK